MADKLEERARAEINRVLAAAGWSVQSMNETNIHAARRGDTWTAILHGLRFRPAVYDEFLLRK